MLNGIMKRYLVLTKKVSVLTWILLFCPQQQSGGHLYASLEGRDDAAIEMQQVDCGQSVDARDVVQLSDAEPPYMNTRMTTVDYINAWGEHHTLTTSCRPQMYKQNSYPTVVQGWSWLSPPPLS